MKSIRATKRQDGGPVRAGQLYMTGERGPELIIPKSDGMVIPNHALGNRKPGAPGGNVTMTVQGLNVKQFFNGQQVRDLAEQMLAFQRNGGQVVLA